MKDIYFIIHQMLLIKSIIHAQNTTKFENKKI